MYLKHGKNFIVAILVSLFSINGNADELNSFVKKTDMGGVYNRATKLWYYSFTIKNTSTAPLTDLVFTFKGAGSNGYFLQGGEYNEDGDPFLRLVPDGGLLKPGQTITVPHVWIPTLPSRGWGYESAVITGTMLTAENSAFVPVSVFNFSDDPDNPKGSSAGAGAKIYVRGVLRATTDASGNAQVQLPLEVDDINATGNGYWGASSITYNAKLPDPVTIILGNEAEGITNQRLIVEEAKHGLVSRSAASMSLQFTDGLNKLLSLSSLSNVLISNDSGDFALDVSDKFNLSNGKIVCTDVAGLMQLFGGAGDRMTITVSAGTAIDDVSGVAKIYIGEHTLKGRLIRPESNTALNLANVVVLAKVNKSGLVLVSKTDADGNFEFPDLPQEQVLLTIETLQGGLYYYGDASVSMTSDVDVEIKLGTVHDIMQEHKMKSSSTVPDAAVRNLIPPRKVKVATADEDDSPIEAQLRVSTQSPDMQFSTAEIVVPQGTKELNLGFDTWMPAWPGILYGQEGGGDSWTFNIFNNQSTKRIYSISRTIYEQLNKFPLIDPEFNTEVGFAFGAQPLDITALTKDGPATLTLTATAAKASSSNFSQGVNVYAGSVAALTITAAKPVIVSGVSKGDGTYFSVPRQGKANVNRREFDISYNKSNEVTLKNLKVQLISSRADALVFDAPISTDWSAANGKIKARVTFSAPASPISSDPAPQDETISYRFILDGASSDGSTVSASYLAQNYHPLWRLPDGFKRYSRPADKGEDDWAAAKTIDWLNAYRDQVPAINDISGEHAIDLGHESHQKGTDIDVFHFYKFPGGSDNSGGSHYQLLLARINELPLASSSKSADQQKAATAKEQIVAWVGATRDGIDRVAALPYVSKIYYIGNGPAANNLAGGVNNWGHKLLTTGKIKVNGVEYDLGVGEWSNPKHAPYKGHHHHVHISLKFN